MRFGNKSGIVLGVALGALVWMMSLLKPSRSGAECAPAQSGFRKGVAQGRLSTINGHLPIYRTTGPEWGSAWRGALLLQVLDLPQPVRENRPPAA